MSPLYSLFIPFLLSLFLVGWIHPRLVKIALLKNIVDNPDARKLQRTPVPVLSESGASIDVQLYAVAGMSLLATFGLYHFMQWHLDRNTELLRKIRRIGYGIHISRTRGFIWLQKTIDRI